MGLAYPATISHVIIGTKVNTVGADGIVSSTVITPWTLTSAYQTEGSTKPTKTFKTAGYSKLNLDILYTEGATESANSIETKIEGSPDGVNFFKIPNETVSGGTSTLTAREFTFVGADAAASTISIGLDIFYRYVRVSQKETGVVTNAGTTFVEATLAGR